MAAKHRNSQQNMVRDVYTYMYVDSLYRFVHMYICIYSLFIVIDYSGSTVHHHVIQDSNNFVETFITFDTSQMKQV